MFFKFSDSAAHMRKMDKKLRNYDTFFVWLSVQRDHSGEGWPDWVKCFAIISKFCSSLERGQDRLGDNLKNVSFLFFLHSLAFFSFSGLTFNRCFASSCLASPFWFKPYVLPFGMLVLYLVLSILKWYSFCFKEVFICHLNV